MATKIPWNLIVSKLRQDITPENDNHLNEWLTVDKNREIFEELQLLWLKVQNHTANYTPDINHYWNELSKRMDIAETSQDIKSPQKRLLPFRRYAAVASLLLLITLSLTLYMGIKIGQPKSNSQVCTNLSGKSKVCLPDRTEVWLHTNTSLTYNTDYEQEKRLVHVTGEAYFDVTHNIDKPFIVQTEGMKVIVHGTKFNVEAFPNSNNTFVSLVEGSVELKTDKEQRFLIPGETATFDRQKQQLKIEKSDVNFLSSWAKDRLIFTEKSLGYVCRSLSRWYHVDIDVAPELSDQFLYTFTLYNEPLEEILRLMARVNPISYSFNSDNKVTIYPKQANEVINNL